MMNDSLNEFTSVLKERIDECCGCNACISACPIKCIQIRENSEGFAYPNIDIERCINCKRCEKACPVLAMKTSYENKPKTWAATASNTNILYSSSSGGVFSLLAQEVIKSGGYVYGAAFAESFHRVKHIRVEDIKGLDLLKTSKYLQSDIEDIYNDVKEQLKTGRKILFSGTPCQVAGLKSFLESEYENLICVAVICHGVPSPKLWSKYLDAVQSEMGGIITFVNFRSKVCSWAKSEIYTEKDEKTYFSKRSSDPYLQMFLNNNCLRESCYNCFAKKNNSVADITLGDFWGISKVLPGEQFDTGASLVMINTERGNKLFEEISACVNRHQADYQSAISYNSLYNNSAIRPINRDLFFKDLDIIPWSSFVRKYGAKKNMKVLLRDIYHKLKVLLLGKRKKNGEYGVEIHLKI